MFNIVKYRFWFLLASLLVIIPGIAALIFFGLKPGIDFVGGTTATIRPQRDMTVAEFKKQLDPLKLPDLTISTAQDPGIPANKTVWVRLNTQVDTNVQDEVKKRLNQKYPEAKFDISTIPGVSGGKPFTLFTVSGFKDTPKIDDIKTLLKDLPKTSDPIKNTGNPTPTATGTAQPTSTAQATATPKPTATATPQPNSTPAVTPTATDNSSNPANIAVNVTDVQQGQTTTTIGMITSSHSFLNTANDSKFSDIQASLLANNGPYLQILNNQSVGPSVATDTTRNAILAVLAASGFILLYVWFAFHKVPNAWRYGICAIVALLHDVLIVLGIFAVLGHFLGIQVNALFITALLTVVGFSVHDTIVVFDRIRENLYRRNKETFEEVVNASLVQTMSRSLNTSMTVLFTLLTLTIFTTPGTDVHNFTLTLLIGIFSGTYSSIFNASMMLVIWETGNLGFKRSGPDHDLRVSTKREGRELARTR